MSSDRYRFKLGDFECLAIRDTATARGNADMMFPNVSHSNLRIENIDPDLIPYDRICLAVHTGAEWVLLDTGLGFMKEESKLARILAEEHIEPRHIILTHLDGDHYGGLVNSDKTPAFPNAEICIPQCLGRFHFKRGAFATYRSTGYASRM